MPENINNVPFGNPPAFDTVAAEYFYYRKVVGGLLHSSGVDFYPGMTNRAMLEGYAWSQQGRRIIVEAAPVDSRPANLRESFEEFCSGLGKVMGMQPPCTTDRIMSHLSESQRRSGR